METPALARMSGENDPFTILGAVTPKGAPMRALLEIQRQHSDLLAALERAEYTLSAVAAVGVPETLEVVHAAIAKASNGR